MSSVLSVKEYKKLAKKPSKYRNVRTMVDGIGFPSKREANRWKELRLLEADGQIEGLLRQPRYELVVSNVRVGTYVADFVYVENNQPVIEDVKGFRDRRRPAYQLFLLKAALVKAIYGIEVRQV